MSAKLTLIDEVCTKNLPLTVTLSPISKCELEVLATNSAY